MPNLRTDYSRYYPVSGAALNHTNAVLNTGGGGGGGGAVSSVNAKTGDVVLTLNDIVDEVAYVEGQVAFVNDVAAPSGKAVSISASGGVTAIDPTTGSAASLSPGAFSVMGISGNGAVLNAPSSAGTFNQSLPSADGVLALKSEIPSTPGAVGAAPATHTHSIVQVTGLQTALDAKLAKPTGTASATTYARGDGTWGTPPDTNTTYVLLTAGDAQTGTATTAQTISAKVLADEIERRVQVKIDAFVADVINPLEARIAALETP